MFEFWLNVAEVCSQWSNLQYDNIGSDNGLVPARRQAIIWINEVPVYWRIYTSLGHNELNTLG